MIKLVETLRGQKKIDIENKLVENAEGEMVSYTEVVMRTINNKPHFLYVTSKTHATALTLAGHRKAKEISEEQKQANLKSQAVKRVMSEGYGDY